MTKLYLAIPCYNEEEVLHDSAEKLLVKYTELMNSGKITEDSKIVFIDDGSKDRTWEIIKEQPQPRSPERALVRTDDAQGQGGRGNLDRRRSPG